MRRWLEGLKRPVKGYELGVVLLVCITLVVAALAINFADNRKTERKFCNLIASNIQVFNETPPPTDTGRNLQRNWIDLKREFHCPPKKGLT